MPKFSVLRPNLFPLGLFFFLVLFTHSPKLPAWNPDYAYDLPKQRRMCVRREGHASVFFYSIASEENCPATERRYLVVFAREPKGAVALLATTSSRDFYPPLTLKWPPDENPTAGQLWHFTCVKTGEKDILGSKVQLYQYLGEMTANATQDCLAAEGRALRYCQEAFKGEALLEACPIAWGK
jgi:hypothetical protein